MIEIPMTSDASQTFSISINDQVYDLRILFNSRVEQWEMDVAQNGTDIINGVGLVGGIDIFDQYTIPIKNAFVINSADKGQDPTFENLGTGSTLVIYTDEELESV